MTHQEDQQTHRSDFAAGELTGYALALRTMIAASPDPAALRQSIGSQIEAEIAQVLAMQVSDSYVDGLRRVQQWLTAE